MNNDTAGLTGYKVDPGLTVEQRIAEWIVHLNTLHPSYATFWLDKPGRKFTRVVGNLGGQLSVHAFVDADGNVYKADGWKRPAKGVRYSVRDDEQYIALTNLDSHDWAGGYLYL